MENIENKNLNEQATVYIETICNLFNVSEQQKSKMYDGLALIQQELSKYAPYDVRVAINKYYKYKSSKVRPNLYQIVAELTGSESDYYPNSISSNSMESFEKFKKEAIDRYYNSQKKRNEKIDKFMLQYIQIQANILAKANISVGLDCEFSRIKPTQQESARYSCLLYYLRSKEFADTVRSRKTISVAVPSDVSEKFKNEE